MAEKMLTNWFAFLLHKFLKVRRDGAETPAAALLSHRPAIPGVDLGLKQVKRCSSEAGEVEICSEMPTCGAAVTWAESSCHSFLQPSDRLV